MGTNVLSIALNVADGEKIACGADVGGFRPGWQMEVTQNGDFNNTTNPLVVRIGPFEGAPYPTLQQDGSEVGRPWQIGTEMLLITNIAVNGDYTFSRGYRGTTIAAHANGQMIWSPIAAKPVGATLYLPIWNDGAAITPALATQAYADMVNGSATEEITAVRDSATQVTVTNAGTDDLACSETMAGAGNQWASATVDGVPPPLHSLTMGAVRHGPPVVTAARHSPTITARLIP